ncbi:phosphate acyltransferase [Alicyclobacillus cellulosilyticus]|uniref:Phosphate acyltransferase n=1 Tax=Alicyclobacillus cellulosilyticus TaxID=1003997 RepID=A0A917KD74_9BACL|nr:phosphate acyltransferase PlsX [Alicyclobacillus cellulosilyticus]GGJ08028.1 phosphate acyltransferase [Alicyclobacillus cellulosilyticus]
MRIVVDAMGGDHAPLAPVSAVCAFAAEHPRVSFTLVGSAAAIRGVRADLPANVEVLPAGSVIEAGEEPVQAVRRKQDSSLVLAAEMVADGRADIMVSAGNTGALVAAGLLVIGRMHGIDRPALAPVLPTFDGRGVLLLDAGATMDAKPQHLLQFAHMGAVYSQYVLGVKRPRVGLLNVGTEAGKGNQLTKATYDLLARSNLAFIGNLEARDLMQGTCDVVVCDGFVGNVVLKLVEGVGLGLFNVLRDALTTNLRAKCGAILLKPTLKPLFKRFDYSEYGGAPFLGVQGGCMKAHGSSNQRAWYAALAQSVRFVEQDLLRKMSAALSEAGAE